MLELSGCYYRERRLLAFLIIIMMIGFIGIFLSGHWQHGPLYEVDKVLLGTITLTFIFLAYSVHLKIRHIESIRHYLKKQTKKT